MKAAEGERQQRRDIERKGNNETRKSRMTKEKEERRKEEGSEKEARMKKMKICNRI